MSPTSPDRLIPRDLAERMARVEHIGHATDPGPANALDAARWRQIAALLREIDEDFQGMGDDDMLDCVRRALRDFPVLVQRRHDYRLVTDRLRRHGWAGDPIEAIDDAARKLIQRVQLLDVFDAVNNVAGPNVWLKRMREAIEQMEHNDGDSMLCLLSKALDARGTVDDLFGVWDTTGPDEGGQTGDTGDVEG